MTKMKVTNWLQKNTMVLILVLVFVFFAFQKDGAILLPQNITNLIAQNAYVFILATGMLLCILTGGNIDLSVGSVVCFTGAIGALLMAGGMNMWLAVIIMLVIGLAGVLTIARMASAQPTYGDGYEMDAIGACFIGGASAYGGVGTVPGVIIGAVLMGVINLGMSIMGIDQNFQKVVKGGVLLAAVVFDVISKRNESR